MVARHDVWELRNNITEALRDDLYTHVPVNSAGPDRVTISGYFATFDPDPGPVACVDR